MQGWGGGCIENSAIVRGGGVGGRCAFERKSSERRGTWGFFFWSRYLNGGKVFMYPLPAGADLQSHPREGP